MITHRYSIPSSLGQLAGYLPYPSPRAEQNRHFCMIKFVMFHQVSETQCYLSLTSTLHKAVWVVRVRVGGEQDRNILLKGASFFISHRTYQNISTLPWSRRTVIYRWCLGTWGRYQRIHLVQSPPETLFLSQRLYNTSPHSLRNAPSSLVCNCDLCVSRVYGPAACGLDQVLRHVLFDFF